MKKKGILWMAAASFLFSCMIICVKFGTSGATAAQAVFFRAVSGLPFLIWIVYRYNIPILSSDNKPLLFFRSLCGFASLTLYFYAVSKIPIGNATILNSTAPIFVVFLSGRILKEKIDQLVFFSLPIFLLGVFMIVKPTHSTEWKSHLLALISGFTASMAYMSIRKLGKTEHTTTVVFYFTMVSLI